MQNVFLRARRKWSTSPVCLHRLYITEGDMKDVNQEHEILKIDDAFNKNKQTQDKPIKCSDIFTLLRENNENNEIVLTKGVAGIGKTVSVHSSSWTGQKEKPIRIYTVCSCFHSDRLTALKTESSISMSFSAEILSSVEEPGKIKLYEECKLAFIFDGLDESRLTLEFESGIVNDVEERSSVDMLFTGLVKGQLLPSSSGLGDLTTSSSQSDPSWTCGFVHRSARIHWPAEGAVLQKENHRWESSRQNHLTH